jgi:hypothetical protein
LAAVYPKVKAISEESVVTFDMQDRRRLKVIDQQRNTKPLQRASLEKFAEAS